MSTATLIRAAAPAPAPDTSQQPDLEHVGTDQGEPAAPATLAGRPSPMGAYVSYVGYFVGTGLISGGIVHYPLDPARYGKVGLAGAVVFLLATLFHELVLNSQTLSPVRLARVAGASLLLSLGIGMLSGGIQHFTDFPHRGAILVPAGIVLSFLAHAVRYADRPMNTIRRRNAVAVLLVSVLAYFALQFLAARVVPEESGHAHGTTSATTSVEDEGHGTSSSTAGEATHGVATTVPAQTEGDLQRQAEVLAELAARLQDLKSDG